MNSTFGIKQNYLLKYKPLHTSEEGTLGVQITKYSKSIQVCKKRLIINRNNFINLKKYMYIWSPVQNYVVRIGPNNKQKIKR